MKIIFNLISIIMVTIVIFLAYLNTETGLSFVIWKGLNHPNMLVYHSRFFQVILIVFLLGIFTGTSWASAYYSPIEKKLKEYQRKLEKTSVHSDEGHSKVAVLEEKVKVLEHALRKALEKPEEEKGE